jgi:hypothetical protein
MGSSEKGEELLTVVFKKEKDGEEAINRDEWLLYTCHRYSYTIDWIL